MKDLRAKVHGSHNPHTTIRALFEVRRGALLLPPAAPPQGRPAPAHAFSLLFRVQAFDAIRSPEEVALERGREVIRVNPGADFMTHARFPAGRTVLFT